MTVAGWLFGVVGAVLAGIGAFFILVRPALLPEDLRFLHQGTSEIDAAVPRLRAWLRLVFMVLGGQALAAGALTVYVAATAVSPGSSSGAAALAIAGAASIGVMAAVNFALRSAFRWALLAVAGVWLAATITAAVG
jgi:hypothetical protein